MGRERRIESEPELHDFAACVSEIAHCDIELKNIEQEHADWIKSNPNGSWPGATAKILRCQARKEKAQARLDQLKKQGQ